MSCVCIVKVKEDVLTAVRALADIFFTDENMQGVRTVLLKPNFLNASPSFTGVTTDLRLVWAVVKILKEKGIERIIIGEGSLSKTESVLSSLGVYEFKKLGAEVVNFEKDEWVWVESTLPLVLKRFRLPRSLMESDMVVNLPKMKTHELTTVTIGLKNFIGTLPEKERRVAHIMDMESAIVEVASYITENKKVFTIVDAIYAMEGRLGPANGRAVKMDILIGGDDIVETDATGVRLMGYDPYKVRHILMADRYSLGGISTAKLMGEKIEDVKRNFEMPSGNVISYFTPRPMLGHPPKAGRGSPRKKLFRKLPYLKYNDRCTGCKTCSQSCPMGVIAVNRIVSSIDHANCISCLVCLEACEKNALDYRVTHPYLYGMLKRGRDVYKRMKNAHGQ